MGKFGQPRKGRLENPVSASELFSKNNESIAHQQGRRLTLRFLGRGEPELDRAEFRYNQAARPSYLQRRDTEQSFTWTRVPQALSLLFLDYLAAGLQNQAEDFSFLGAPTRSLAASIGYDAERNTGLLAKLFTEFPPNGAGIPKIQQLFDARSSLGGRKNKDWRIFINNDFLPPDCIEVFWENAKLADQKEVMALADLIRKAWSLEPRSPIEPPAPDTVPTTQPTTPPPPDLTHPDPGETIQAPPAAPNPTPSPVQEPEPKPITPPAVPTDGGENRPFSMEDVLSKLRTFKQSRSPIPPVEPRTQPSPNSSSSQTERSRATSEDFTARFLIPTPPSVTERPTPPPQRIDPELFVVRQTDGHWPDDLALVTLQEGDDDYPWTLRNAFEGTLIFGATGSGKTSGSGALLAEAFLQHGFGGLVLTVKEDEAERWRRFCEYCGRGDDYIAIRKGGPWKLNVLDYEAQRPGAGGGLSKNLVSFCRNLMNISSRNGGSAANERLWEEAGNEILTATFDLFLLANEPITFDGLAKLIMAGEKASASDEAALLQIPQLGNLLLKARNSIRTTEDQRIYYRTVDYWSRFASRPEKMKASITLGVYALLSPFQDRDIPDLISSSTNVTPESIMSGKIVVIDLPIKQMGQTGLLIQSAWKYLFQTALERQGNPGTSKRRPVFLWEDEGQAFFSEHDPDFQATARSSRVARVVLSQNLNNFYKQFGHGAQAAADSMFGNLNTKIFHANSDPLTNEWASRLFGSVLRTRCNFTQSPQKPPTGFWNSLYEMVEPSPSGVGTSTSQNWEPAVRPEEFNRLRTGRQENDFQVDAYVTWLGLSADRNRHFSHTTFVQNPNL